MGGTVDPLTALYATLRDVDAGQECKIKLPMFDGRHSSQIVLGKPTVKGNADPCTGEYRRLAGFSDKEMAEKQRFAFTLTYAPTAEWPQPRGRSGDGYDLWQSGAETAISRM